MESTVEQEREQGGGERVDERGGTKRGRDNEYEYCIEANVVVYSSRGVNTRAKTFSRDAFSTAVTHGEPTRTHTRGQAALKMVTEEGNLRNIFRVGEKSREK